VAGRCAISTSSKKKKKFSAILLLLLHTFAAGIFLSEEHPTAEAGQISREL
jgi:hypothetical protein